MLGELSEKERAEVEQNLRRYPELRKDLEMLEQVQEELLFRSAVTPRPSLRGRVLESVAATSNRQRTLERSGSINYWRLAAAASIIIAMASSYLAYHYRQELKTAQRTLTAFMAENERMAQNYNSVNERLNRVERDLKIIENPEFVRVAMKGTPNAPQALAFAYWNQNSAALFLRVENLKKLPAANQYQLWAIVNGKPVSAGVFDVDAGLIKMNDVRNASAFAVTIEPSGGKKTPTLETMQVLGNVDKG